MTLFEYISIAFSMILAIGVTRLLSAMLDLLRHRRQVRWHWIPLTWATLILVLLFQYWWQIFGVDGLLKELDIRWKNVDYLVMVLYTISIFCAASLILPKEIEKNETLDLWAHFQAEGKLAIWGIIAYGACGPLSIIVVFDQGITSPPTLLNFAILLVGGIPALGVFFSRSERAAGIWTLVFVAFAVAVWMLTGTQQY